jgi:plasmid stability protein
MILSLQHNDAISDAQQGGSMKAVTLRNLPPELSRIIRRRAAEKRSSINRTVIDLLEEGVGIRSKRGVKPLYHDLDALAGAWTKEAGAAFDKALFRQRGIDPELWK